MPPAPAVDETSPFEIQDEMSFRFALYDAIMDQMPDDPFLVPMHVRAAALTRHERLFLAVHIFDVEACNEGAQHFFLHDSGDLCSSLIEGLQEIGMQPIARTLQEFVSTVFGGDYPLESDARKAVMLSGEGSDPDPLPDYHEMGERVSENLVTWARAGRVHFSCGAHN